MNKRTLQRIMLILIAIVILAASVMASQASTTIGAFTISDTEVTGRFSQCVCLEANQHMTFYLTNGTTTIKMSDFKWITTINTSARTLSQFGSYGGVTANITYTYDSKTADLNITYIFVSAKDFGRTYFWFNIENQTNAFDYSRSLPTVMGKYGTWNKGFITIVNFSRNTVYLYNSFHLPNDTSDTYESKTFHMITPPPPIVYTYSPPDPVETRYFRQDNVLSITESSTKASTITTGTQYYGIKVYNVTGGTSNLISGANAVAIAQGTGQLFNEWLTANWNCPLTTLASTDNIKVEIYRGTTSPPTSLVGTWNTEALGATQLDSATWTAGYYHEYYQTCIAPRHLITCEYTDPICTDHWRLSWGTSTYNTNIAGFSWTAGGVTPSPPVMDVGDPLACSIPYLIPLLNTPILCMPKSNITGQPLTGQTINCQAQAALNGYVGGVQASSAATEQANGLYNWTLLASNLAANTCYTVNCSTSIGGTLNNIGSVLCVLPAYTTSCSSTADVNNAANGINLNITQALNNQTLIKGNLTLALNNQTLVLNNITLVQNNQTLTLNNITLVLNNETLILGNETTIQNLILSLTNLTATQVWENATAPDRTLTEAVCSITVNQTNTTIENNNTEIFNYTTTNNYFNSTNETYNTTINNIYALSLTHEELRNISKNVWKDKEEFAPDESQKLIQLGLTANFIAVIIVGILLYITRRK